MYCKVNTKTRELSILNGTVYSDGSETNQWNLSVHERNLLMQSYEETITKEIPALKEITDRKKIFTIVDDLQKDLDLLIQLKTSNVRSEKDRCSFKSSIEKLMYSKLKKIIPITILEPDLEKASEIDLIENVILNSISDLVNQELRYDYFLDNFDVESEDTSKIDKFESILASYDLSGVSGQLVTDNIKSHIQISRKIIEAFSAIKNQAKDELLIWSSQKISRRLNDLGLRDMRWRMHHLLENYKRVLKNKGVKVEVKTKESPTKQVMKKWAANKELSQDELFTVIKNVTSSYDIDKVLSRMDFNNLVNVINSDLKAISNKFNERPNNILNSGYRDNVKNMTKAIKDKTPKDADLNSFNVISNFIVNKQTSGYLDWEFIIKFEEIVPNNLVLSFLGTSPALSSKYLSDKFYDKHIRCLSMTKKVTSCQTTTTETLRRLSLEDRIKYLEVMDKPDLKLTRPQFSRFYSECDWIKVKGGIKNHTHLRNVSLDLIQDKKDKEMAAHIITTQGDLNTSDILKMFDVLDTFDEKLESYLKFSSKNKEQFNHYSGDSKFFSIIRGVFGRKTDLEKLLEKLFENSLVKDVTTVYKVAVAEKVNMNNINNIILKNVSKLNSFELGNDLIPSMSIDLKKALLKEDVELSFRNTYYYGGSTKNPTLDSFFEGLSRSDINETLGGIDNKYTMYLARFMTREELAAAGDRLKDFVRLNISFFNYGYLQKYKDKNLFKQIVGDRRNGANSQFANILLEKLQVTNTVDFFANLDD